VKREKLNLGEKVAVICEGGAETAIMEMLLVAEDPVCGSAHCQIADYWSKELGKTGIHAYQASKRGGHLYCEMLDNGRIAISGEATLVAVSEIVVWEDYFTVKCR